jgi:hypothetical protein
MKTIDLKKSLKPFYTASASKPAVIDVPALNALMVDGTGDPNSPVFQEAVGSLYSVAWLRGRHHEIYFGDPRRSAPEKLKTIIRHPVEPA